MSNLPYDAKHPVILPKKHRISRLVIAHIHNQGNHNLGVNVTLAELRQKYWIVNGREEIKQWERECNACKLGRKRRGQQIMAPLPEARLGTSLRCFAHCGVDFAAPFVVKLTRKVTAKRYLCLFTCTSTLAVHLEVAYSLDTASFLNAFSRMVTRRGKPEVTISDNGSNFTSTERELRQLVQLWIELESKNKPLMMDLSGDSNPRWIPSWRNFRSPHQVCKESPARDTG